MNLFRTRTSSLKSPTAARGSIYLEVALFLPVVIVLIFGALDTVRVLNKLEIVSELSRTIGITAFRDCGKLPEGDVLSQGNLCLYNSLTERFAPYETLLPDREFIVQVYKRGAFGPELEQRYDNRVWGSTNKGQYEEPSEIAKLLVYKNNPDKDKVLTVEVFYEYEPMFNLFGTLRMYETMIL